MTERDETRRLKLLGPTPAAFISLWSKDVPKVEPYRKQRGGNTSNITGQTIHLSWSSVPLGVSTDLANLRERNTSLFVASREQRKKDFCCFEGLSSRLTWLQLCFHHSFLLNQSNISPPKNCICDLMEFSWNVMKDQSCNSRKSSTHETQFFEKDEGASFLV